MAKFASIAKGTRARKRIRVRWVGATEPVDIDVRVMRSDERADVLAKARQYAIDKGVPDPGPGEAIYDLATWAYTCEVACVDPESPEDAPEPYFTDGVSTILSCNEILPDHLAYIYEHQENWQDEHSPYESSLSHVDFMNRLLQVAGGDLLPFVELRPGLRWNFVRTMAIRLVASQTGKLLDGTAWLNPTDANHEVVADA